MRPPLPLVERTIPDGAMPQPDEKAVAGCEHDSFDNLICICEICE